MKLPFSKKSHFYIVTTVIALTFLAIGAASGYWYSSFMKKTETPPTAKIVTAQEAFKNRDTVTAFKNYLMALAEVPSIKQILYGLAQTASQAKKYELAAAFLSVAQTIDHNNPVLLLAMVQAQLHLKNNEAALTYLRALAQTKLPQSEEITLQISRLFAEVDALPEALTYAEKAATQNPRSPVALANVGNMHNRLGNLEKAVDYYKKALALNPNIPNIIYNLGYTLKRQGKLQEALSYLDRAITLKPGYLDALIDRAYTYWALGDFERAWQDYAWRFKMHGADPTTTLPMPLWDGRDLKGKTILLYAEQGLGDTLQFIRLAESVKKHGNPRIICKVQKPLLKLLQSYPYVDTLVTTYETKGVDYQAPLMSLPGILKLSPTTIPAPTSYLTADKKLVTDWHKKLNSSDHEFRVGLCWHVDPIHEKDKSPVSRRSIAIKDFLPLSTIPNVSFYALQQGTGLDEINTLPESFKLTAFDPYFDKRHGSFMDSAAVITNLDLVITVDTAIAHLAGALGKEVWIFLPFSPDGRWSHTTHKTPWYPTATLFRQTTPSDWQQPLQNMHKLLQQRATEKSRSLKNHRK